MIKDPIRKIGLVFVFMVFGLVGCGGGGSSSSPNDTSRGEPNQVEDPVEEEVPVEEETPTEEEPVDPTVPDPGPSEDHPVVTSLTVYGEEVVPVDTTGYFSFSRPFVGLSESGVSLAVWSTSDYDVFGGSWSSTLHYSTGDFSTKTWATVQSLILPQIGSLRMDMGGNGDAVIALSHDEGVSVFHYTVAGGLDSPIRLKSVDSTSVVALEVNGNGDALLVWKEFNTGHLVSRLYNKANQSWGSEFVLNVATNGDTYTTQGHVAVDMNDAGQALFVDSVVQSGQSGETVIIRRHNGTNWSELRGDETALFPYADADSVSAYLDEKGRIVVGMGLRAPGRVYIAPGTITDGLSEASLAFYESGQGLFQLDARWTGETQITASYVNRDLGSTHYVSSSQDSGSTWRVDGFINGNYGNDSAKSSNSNKTIYIQDGSQCESATKFRAPLIALNHDLSVTRACVINRMTSVDLSVNDAGQGVVMGKHDAIDSFILHFFGSNY